MRLEMIVVSLIASVTPADRLQTFKAAGSGVRPLRFALTIALALLVVGFPRGVLYGAHLNSSQKGKIPAYHPHPTNGALPEVQPPNTFSDQTVRAIYAMAAKIRAVLYQEPCYCRCDRSLHHTCLLDCFVTRHASVCGICLMEAAYAYEQIKKGKTPSEIRREIERGDWRQIVLSNYSHLRDR